MAKVPWDPSMGRSTPPPATAQPKARYAPCRPRGLPFLEGVLSQPHADRKLTAFVRFREYVERRSKRKSRISVTDRARAAELATLDAHTIVNRQSLLDLNAATWSVIYRIAVTTNTSPKTIIEALVTLGLEQVSYAVRADGVASAIAC